MPDIGELRIDQPMARPRRKRRGNFPWLGLLLALVALGWYFRASLPLQEIARGIGSPGAGAQVELFTVQAQSGPGGSFSAGGYLEVMPPGPLEVSSLVAGRLDEILVRPGESVEQGQLVARLDSSLYRNGAAVIGAQLKVAEAQQRLAAAPTRLPEVDSRGAIVASAESRLRQAESNHERNRYLYEQGVIPLQEFESSRTAVELALAELDSLKSQLELAVQGPRPEEIDVASAHVNALRAQLGELSFHIAQCEIRAPLAGVVYEQLAPPGSWLAPGEGDKQSAAILSIFDPAALQVWVDVNQRDSAQVSTGQRVLLEADSAPGQEFGGTVAYFMPQASLQKNTVRAIVLLDPEHGLRLLPEMSLKITFLPPELSEAELAARPTGVLVPATAVMDAQGNPAVFAVVDGKAQRRSVIVGAAEGDQLRITSGLSGGEQIVLSPAGISEGQAISPAIQNSEEGADAAN